MHQAEVDLHRPAAGHDDAGPDRDILNIGGCSDAVFSVFASSLDDDGNRFVSEIEAIEL